MVKSRFTNLDIVAILPELNQKLKGLRVNQIYDIDHKTYLIRFNPPTATSGAIDSTGKLVQPSIDLNDEAEEDASKTLLLIESGMRIHTTTYKWPKNPTPTGMFVKYKNVFRIYFVYIVVVFFDIFCILFHFILFFHRIHNETKETFEEQTT